MDNDCCYTSSTDPFTLSLFFLLGHLQEEEDKELAKSMMAKKTKRLYGRMQHGIAAKQDEIKILKEKEKANSKANSSKANKSKAAQPLSKKKK